MDSRKLSGKKVVDLSLKLGLPDHINGGQVYEDEDEDEEISSASSPPTVLLPLEQEQFLLKRFSYTPIGIQMDLGECSNSKESQQCRARQYQLLRDPVGMTRRWGCWDGGSSSSAGGSGGGSVRGRFRLPLQVGEKKGEEEEEDGHIRRRCTNLNCNTLFTPMWRRGPLGPKTLCNACGIKYRKDKEKCSSKQALNPDP